MRTDFLSSTGFLSLGGVYGNEDAESISKEKLGVAFDDMAVARFLSPCRALDNKKSSDTVWGSVADAGNNSP
jgi:hypothetical protein